MTPIFPTPSPSARLRKTSLAMMLLAIAASPALAQYKVVGPDGKITYTDRPPTTSDGKATTLNTRNVGAASGEAALPIELRNVASRYPVTLYTVTGACEPCAGARQYLRQRGIPYVEKQIQSPEDTQALQRIAGSTDIPTLTVGGQVLRGLAADVWSSYLDAAGYPRESKLPQNYQYAAATPIVERRDATVPARPATPAPAAAPADVPPANPSGIKF